MDSPQRRDAYLQAMGVTQWVTRHAPAHLPAPNESPRGEGDGRAAHGTPMDWAQLEAAVASCTACPLHESRTRPVFGVGDRHAGLMLIGEAPGAEEDRRGEPFVGRAGQLLNAMLHAIGLEREQVYIANILKSRPPNNRDPRPEEVAACAPYLRRQIELIEPRVILALGRVAAQNLLGTDQRLGAMRGKVHTYPGTDIPVVVTYHPAYLLRTPQDKRKAWQDLQFAMKQMGRD